jgi:hypothetical protein
MPSPMISSFSYKTRDSMVPPSLDFPQPEQLRFSSRGLLSLSLVVAVLIGFAVQQRRVGVLQRELEELRNEQQSSNVELRRAIVNQRKSQLEQQRLTIRQNALEDYVRDPPARYEPLAIRDGH